MHVSKENVSNILRICEMENELTIVLYVKELCKNSPFVIQAGKNNTTKVWNNIVMSKWWHNCPFCMNYLLPDQLPEAQLRFLQVTLIFQWTPPVDVHMDVRCGSTGEWLTLFPIPLCPKQASKSLWATQEKATHAIPIQPTSSGHEPLFDSVFVCNTFSMSSCVKDLNYSSLNIKHWKIHSWSKRKKQCYNR